MFFSKPNRQKPFMKPAVLNNKIQNRVRLLIIKHTCLCEMWNHRILYGAECSISTIWKFVLDWTFEQFVLKKNLV